MSRSSRLTSVDALRGIVMIIMALDHVRDYFHAAAMNQPPTNLATTTPAIFLTRWVTHFCAPVFLFLAGVGAFLWLRGGARSKAQLSRFLLTRGLWLIVLEVVVMRIGLYFSLSPQLPVLLITLWALGASMVVLAGLIHLPLAALASLSALTIVLHNLTDGVQASSFGSLAWIWNVLHQQGAIPVAGHIVVVGYPLLSLVATMAAGYCAGHLFQMEAERRQQILSRLGMAMIVGFGLLRAINVYGDPARWTVQPSGVMTALSFLNCTKQPASLDFLLMTLGPALLLLAWLDRNPVSEGNALVVFGRVPLFYFLAHFYLIHAAQIAVTWFRYGNAPFLLLPPPTVGGPRDQFPRDFGFDLWIVYLVWILVVAAMYPACLWYSRLKSRKPSWWLSYL